MGQLDKRAILIRVTARMFNFSFINAKIFFTSLIANIF